MDLAKQVCVFADDLTGAADTAQYFRAGVHPVRIVLPGTNLSESESREPVLVYDTESREENLTVATDRTKRAIARMLAWNPAVTRIYKKVDSTLRGNIGVEIETTLLELGREVAILAPAFPEHGRTVVAGVLFVDGVPVDETAFAKDPHHPMGTAAIAQLVRHTTASLHVHQMSLDVLRQGPLHVRRLLNGLSRPAVVIVDTKTTADLDILAGAVHDMTNCLPCGSAGLAEALASYWVHDQRARLNVLRGVGLPRCTEWMVVVGSANPVSRAQLGVLNGNDLVASILVDPVALAGSDRDKERRRVESELALRRSPVISLGIATSDSTPRLQTSANLDLPMAQPAADLGEFAAGWVLSALAAAAKSSQRPQPHPLPQSQPKLGIIATGGATAVALCRALGVESLLVQGEVMSGVPWSVIQVHEQDIVLVTKAGGFGAADTLEQVIEAALSQIEEES